MGWHKPYNVSGTVHCGGRLDDWCGILRKLLRTDEVGMIGHYTGAVTVGAQSPLALVISSGFDMHEFYARVFGDQDQWMEFGRNLEQEFAANGLPYSLVVHDEMVISEASG